MEIKGLHGWRLSLLAFTAGAVLTSIFNIILAVWVTTSGQTKNGVGILYEGSCDKTRNLNIGGHVVINVLSTILLVGSNYCMQVLTAPTRGDIDNAHRERKWMDVGVQSIRNLGRLSTSRRVLWLLLSISSLPIHLLYNSALYSSLSVNTYGIVTINERFLQSGHNGFNKTLQSKYGDSRFTEDDEALVANLHERFMSGGLTRLDNLACMNKYSEPFQKNYGNLLLVLQEPNLTISDTRSTRPPEFDDAVVTASFGNVVAITRDVRLGFEYSGSCGSDQPYDWICSQISSYAGRCPIPCEILLPEIRKLASDWKPASTVNARGDQGNTIQYCLSDPVEDACQLQAGLHIIILIAVLDIMKAAIFCFVASQQTSPFLLTIGDAISSFIAQPDAAVKDLCLISKDEIASMSEWSAPPKAFENTRRHWFRSIGTGIWVIGLVLYLIFVGAVAGLLAYAIITVKFEAAFRSISDLGFGKAHPRTLIQSRLSPDSIFANVLLVNTPQLIISALYFFYNSLFTRVAVSNEYANFALHRKGLRVSAPPKGLQRETYFLGLPFRFAIPLIVSSGTIHWLASQSFFLVSIHLRDMADKCRSDRRGTYALCSELFVTCAFSPAAMICVMVMGIMLTLSLFVTGLRRFKAGMPVVGTCSASLASACYRSSEGEDDDMGEMESTQALKWGVVSTQSTDKGNRRETVGHCSFSSGDVSDPVPGGFYSGRCG